MKYEVYIEETAVETITGTRGRKRSAIKNFIRSLDVDPFNEGDFFEFDRIGRKVFTKIVADYAISFWPDHPVKEIKVFQISKADE
jgi:hypothetical protein